jgi:hypothetical protein
MSSRCCLEAQSNTPILPTLKTTIFLAIDWIAVPSPNNDTCVLAR